MLALVLLLALVDEKRADDDDDDAVRGGGREWTEKRVRGLRSVDAEGCINKKFIMAVRLVGFNGCDAMRVAPGLPFT